MTSVVLSLVWLRVVVCWQFDFLIILRLELGSLLSCGDLLSLLDSWWLLLFRLNLGCLVATSLVLSGLDLLLLWFVIDGLLGSLEDLLARSFFQWWESLEPSVVAGFVTLDARNHFLVICNYFVVTLKLLFGDTSSIAVESLRKLVVFAFNSLVFEFSYANIQRLCSVFADIRAEGWVANQITLALSSHALVYIDGCRDSCLVLAYRKLLSLGNFDEFVQQDLVMMVQYSVLLYTRY